MTYKVVQLEDVSGRRAVRCWLPRGTGRTDTYPTEGAWAAESVRAFEAVLRDYLRDISGADLEAQT